MKGWLALSLSVEAAHAVALSDALEALGAISVELSDGATETAALDDTPEEPFPLWARCRITALFPEGADGWAIAKEAARLAALPAVPTLEIIPVSERDWVRETQSQFGPFQVSSRLWVVPSWAAPPPHALIALRLDPGIAFGTGSHPTTRLCLRWLDAMVRGGEHVLDYGCGSGILAIAALKLGAARAVGVDIDPLALAASRENARLNQVAAEFLDPAQLPADFRADLLVANILARPLMLLAPVLVQALRPGGRLALAGILEEQAEAVAEAYRPALVLTVAAAEENWVLLAGERGAP